MLPAGQGSHGVAVHQGDDVASHAVVPGAAVRVDLGVVGDGVAAGAQVGGHCVEGGEVEAGQVNPFHGESSPGDAWAVEWGSYAALCCPTGDAYGGYLNANEVFSLSRKNFKAK